MYILYRKAIETMSQKTTISMIFPTGLLKRIDSLAKDEDSTRSDFIRRAALRATQQHDQKEARELKRLSTALAADVKAAGYRTEADFHRLAAQIRADRDRGAV